MALLKDILTELASYIETNARLYAFTDNPSDLDRYVLIRKLLNIGDTQSITGAKTFDINTIKTKGTSTGVTTISTANTGASNYTATLPPKTGTLAMTSDVEVLVFTIGVAASPLDTDLEVATDQAIIAAPEDMTVTQVFAKVGTPPVGSTIIVDIHKNGTTILSTKISIDASEKTSLTAATPPVISVPGLLQGDEITIDIDQIGASTAGKDLTVYVLGTKA